MEKMIAILEDRIKNNIPCPVINIKVETNSNNNNNNDMGVGDGIVFS
jgi:hypothetical protein